MQTCTDELEDLISWLEKQPPDREYDSSSIHACLLYHWASAAGVKDPPQRAFSLGNVEPFGQIAAIGKPPKQRRTFGAALNRARKVQRSVGAR